MKHKKYDVVVWGGSGFTGKLIVEYLNRKYGTDNDLSWAIAGRNQQKLRDVANSLGLPDLPIIIADSADRASLDIMTSQAKVICATVGPYAKYGSDLVASCIENGTDYCDLAGEAQWIRKMIDKHHDLAVKKGVRIVNCCGFDSIPSDMGVYFLQNQAKEKLGEHCTQIRFRLKAAKGGLSGGTYATMKNLINEAYNDPSALNVLTNPYGLNPDTNYQGKDGKDLTTVKYEKETDSWITPFVMAGINTKVVRRSHALFGFPYGEDFQYDEAIMTGAGTTGWVKSIGNALGIGVMMIGKPGSFFYKIVDRFFPKPGEGPDKNKRENGFFSIDLFGITTTGAKIKANVKGDMDPGYGSTSKMIGECAVCLAKDKDLIPSIYGVITPSVAMGNQLIDRLNRNAGVTIILKSTNH